MSNRKRILERTPSLSLWKPLLSRRTWAPWWSSSEGYVDMATNIPTQHASNKLKHTTPSTPRRYASHLDIFFYYPVGYCMTMILKSVSIGWDTQNLPQYRYWIHDFHQGLHCLLIHIPPGPSSLSPLRHPLATLRSSDASHVHGSRFSPVWLKDLEQWIPNCLTFWGEAGVPPKKNGTCIEASGCFIEIHPWSLTTSLPLKMMVGRSLSFQDGYFSGFLLLFIRPLLCPMVPQNTQQARSHPRVESTHRIPPPEMRRKGTQHLVVGGSTSFFATKNDFCRDIMGWSCWRRGFHPPSFCCLLSATVFGDNMGRDGFSSFLSFRKF